MSATVHERSTLEPDARISTDTAILGLTVVSALLLAGIAVGTTVLSSYAGVALTAAAVATPLPGDAVVVGSYMVSWMGKQPLAPRPKAYMTKAAVGL